MTHRSLALGLVLLTACGGEPYHAPDSGCAACVDADVFDAGTFADAYTYRLPLTEAIGECLPADETECGCIDGFRRCDTCGWCPTGFACDEYAGVCRGLDYDDFHGPSGRTWGDSCSVVVTDGTERDGATSNPDTHFCHTGKVCGADSAADGTVFMPMAGRCFPVSFCQAASVADPPVPTLRCIYSDGTDVVDGPPDRGDCPVGDPRQPYCGGVCADNLRCPAQPLGGGIFGPPSPSYLGSCSGLSETRSFGVCAYGVQRCSRGNPDANDTSVRLCELGYGEPCACLVTHPQLDESRWVLGYVVLASVCRDYRLHFPSSTECVDAAWSPLPPP